MNVVESGTIASAVAGTARAAWTFPCLLELPDGVLLATCRSGSTKDSADEMVALVRSTDGGRTWSEAAYPFAEPRTGLKLCYLTQSEPGKLLAAAMWVDHDAHPGQPLFNPDTEGCLPMAILLAESHDAGVHWSPWRQVPVPADLGAPSLTAPALVYGDDVLLSIESNKHYDDPGPWRQHCVLLHSGDRGATWNAVWPAAEDPHGRLFNWDQRYAIAPDGRIAAFAWTYDREQARYLNIHRRISCDRGLTWSPPEDLGFADQAGRPALLADGRIVLPYVDRFGSRSIRVCMADDVAAPFDPHSDSVVYIHDAAAQSGDGTGELLAAMSIWSFGLPYAEALTNGDILVAYYAGHGATLDIRWARIRLAEKDRV